MRTIPTLLLLSCAALASAADAPAPAPAPAVGAAGKLELPESVAQDADTGTIYCSNIGGDKPTPEAVTAKDGNGFISKLNADGSVADLHFLPLPGEPALNGPKGLAIIGSVLWVADIDRVVGFDLETRKELQSFDLTPFKVTFANDLCEHDGTLLVSDTGHDQVLALAGVDRGKITGAEVIGARVFGGANGIAVKGETVYIAGFPIDNMENGKGFVYQITIGEDLASRKNTGFPAGCWDGLAVTKDGTLIAGDWRSHAVWRKVPGKEPEIIAKDFKGPADFCLLRDGVTLLVPDMPACTVRVVTLPK